MYMSVYCMICRDGWSIPTLPTYPTHPRQPHESAGPPSFSCPPPGRSTHKNNREWRALPPCSHNQKIVFSETATAFYQARIFVCVCIRMSV